ncbi:MAG TPA: hypothetical protein VFM39_05115 [bacterium]|nr:hypothetical protein [bacterium]
MIVGSRTAVYVLRDTPAAAGAAPAVARLDAFLALITRDSGLDSPGLLIYPLYPSAAQFREDWWRFATLRDGVLHGWGTIYTGDLESISSYQVARAVAQQRLKEQGIPLLTWGVGDLIADRLLQVDSHAHARLFVDRGGLPPIESIIHQLDFSRALPGSYVQSVSFLAFLAEERGVPAVVAFAQAVGRRWYDFGSIFEQHFSMTLPQAEKQWRTRLERVHAPDVTDRDFAEYRRVAEFVYRTTLARTPGGLVSRPGGAEAYVEGLRAADALRRFDLASAVRAERTARRAAEAVERQTSRTRLGIQTALWGLAFVPILLAVLLLAGPALRSALYDRRERRRKQQAARQARGRA